MFRNVAGRGEDGRKAFSSTFYNSISEPLVQADDGKRNTEWEKENNRKGFAIGSVFSVSPSLALYRYTA